MQLTRPDPRQKQGTPPTTPLTQVHLQPAPCTLCSSSHSNCSWLEDSQFHPQVCYLMSHASCHSLEAETVNHHLSWALLPWYVHVGYTGNIQYQPFQSPYWFSPVLHHHWDWSNGYTVYITTFNSAWVHCICRTFLIVHSPSMCMYCCFCRDPSTPRTCTHCPHHSPHLVQAIWTVPPVRHCFPTDPDWPQHQDLS